MRAPFRPSIALTLTLVILAALFGRLGWWQLERKAEKEVLFGRFDNAPSLGIGQALAEGERFARVEAIGRYDGQRHILLDNQVWKGRAGVHVLTPFILSDGRQLLVNRGWLPLPPDRSSLPDVPTVEDEQTLSGRLNALPAPGQRLGEPDSMTPDGWPQLITYFDRATVEAALGTTLESWLIQLDPDHASGFEGRVWQAAVMPPKVHGAYAAQWFGLMGAAVVIWVVLGLRRGRWLRDAGIRSGSESTGELPQ
jgi:surfeit locus 1 family protein